MESGRHDDSKTLTEESDQSEEGTDDTGGSRSYKCVYCKQGFTNAQALGGHMNIHRKDRAKIRQPTVASVSNRHEEGYLNPGFFPPTTSYQTNFWASPEVQRMYQTYVPVSTSSTIYPHGYHAEEQRNRKPQPLSLFNDDWRTNLSLQIGPPRTENVEEDRGQDGKEGELDLELRLGHDP